MIVISKSEKQTVAFARRFASHLRGGEIVALVGELGSGKTTFVRGLASYFGIREPVRSPTFTLMHIHRARRSGKQVDSRRIKKIVHVDAYRLRNRRELDAIGFDEHADRPDAVTFVEWADRVGLDRTANCVLRFYHGKKPSQRRFEIKKYASIEVSGRAAY